ncbi:MAG TPA: M23 family metallopeptidase [Clostridia bacterium]|nr:M23 family metallopeptidase [Clostridia bacterium]
MLFEKYKPGKSRFWGGKLFYAILIICICAAGVSAWYAIDSTINTDTQQTEESVDWNNYTSRSVTEKDNENVNVPAKNIPDERKATQKPTEAKTTEKVTQEKKDNIPYIGSFTMPMGTKILKDYSHGEMVLSKTMNDWRVHEGIDFSGNVGQEVVAIQDGVVESVETNEFWGTVVIIKHGNGLVAKYCGLSEGSAAKEGNEVKKGGRIGLLGEIPIEAADGYHLHLEVFVNDENVDPLEAMNKVGN